MLEKEIGTVFEHKALSGLAPSQRIHLILLGVEDVQQSANFYQKLGWLKSATGHEGFVKFDLNGYALCLLPKADLAKDALFENAQTSDFKGTCFVHLVKSAEEVAEVLRQAELAGGTIVKPATRTPYGIAGYFSDPDGYLFEVDYEMPWVFDEEHRLVVDKLNEV